MRDQNAEALTVLCPILGRCTLALRYDRVASQRQSNRTSDAFAALNLMTLEYPLRDGLLFFLEPSIPFGFVSQSVQ